MHIGQVTIDTLSDDALLKIFAFVVDDNDSIEAWHPLVHVCRKWRNIVSEPPHRLYLHLHCTAWRHQALKTSLLRRSHTPIVFVKSPLRWFQVRYWKSFSQRCRYHSLRRSV